MKTRDLLKMSVAMRVVNGFLKKYISVYVQAAAVYVK